MTLPALGLSIAVAAGLWPFSGGSNADATIGSLRRQPPQLDLRVSVPDGSARAREEYQQFLALPGTPGDMRAESMRRLADLYLAAGEEAEAAGGATGGSEDFTRAIALYQQYLQEFPRRGGADEVLYSLSRAQEGVGDPAAALATLDRLVREYPRSTLAAEAEFRRGERLFVLRDYAAAESAFAAVVGAGDAGAFYEQALYKQGWSQFKLGQYEECLEPFLAVLGRRLAGVTGQSDQQALDGLGKAERELVEDTLRAMSLSVSQLDGMAGIDALLDRHGGVPFADVIYGGLGDLYLSQERYGDAAGAYRRFVEREPTHPRAPYLQARVIDAYAAGKFPGKVLEAKAQYVELYGLDSAYWANSAPASRPVVVQHLKESLADLASHDHQRAQQTHAADAYQKAAGWYRRYLAYFPDDPESPQRNFLLAEILFEGGDYDAATVEYQRTAYAYGNHPQAAEAGYAGLLAAREREKALDGAAREAWHQAYIDGQLKFAATFPEHPQAAAVQTSAAEDLYRRGELARAVAVAGEVVTRTPPADPQLEQVAWTVLAHGQFDLGRYADAERAYLRLRQIGGGDAAGRAQVEERIAASVYKQAEAAKAAGDHAAAVAGFLRVAEAAPAASSVPDALYDASALLVADQQWSQAVDVLQRFRREFPQHRFNADVTQKLAVALDAAGRGQEAAGEFEAIAATASLGAEVHREALWRAAELYRKSGQRAAEQRVYEQLVARFPQPLPEAQEARSRLAGLAGDAGDTAARRRWLGAIIAADAAAGAQRTDHSRYLAAHAALELAAPLRDAFLEARLTVPLPKSLKAKKQRLELALAAYGKAADYAVADVTTAATFETAELYYALGRAVLESEKPASLGAEEREEYQLLLEEQAFPFEEKAIELHGLNAERSADGLYDEWVRRSFARLATLSPARYARSERTEAYVAALD
ncbi:MAG: tetratricopeptide repeat protein [Gammaproteobacteria bacterium]|nr:tetratricopeptide repeat protein [Gammaproteobacteria bacterium]